MNTQKEQPKNHRQTESTQRPSPSGPNQSILSACARLTALGMLASLSACAVAAGATREGGDNELVADSTLLWMPNGTENHTSIAMCWKPSAFASGVNEKKFADARAAVVEAIRTTWVKESWLNVTWSDTCSRNMVRVSVEDTADPPAADPWGVKFNFTFANWSQDPCATSETQRMRCIKAIAVHEFGHVLAFPHEQNRINGLGIVCDDGTLIPNEGKDWSLVADWDVTGIDIKSIMSYCTNGSWMAFLTPKDIEGLRAVYGGNSNPIQPNSKAAIRSSDKMFWNGPSGTSAQMAVANIQRRSAGNGGLAYGQTISVQMAGLFLCGQKARTGSSPTTSDVAWKTAFDAASCSWTLNRSDTAAGDNELDVNDPFDLQLKLPATAPNEVAFDKTFSLLRMLRVL
jgi:hypothetical protein